MTRKGKHITLGNPALIAAAASNPKTMEVAEKAIKTLPVIYKQQFKIAGYVVGGLVIVGGIIGGYFLYKDFQKKATYKKAATDPNAKAALDIFNAIPERLKKDSNNIFNAGQLITDWINNLAFWTKADSDRILLIAERITNFKETARVFSVLYNEDLMPLLQHSMSPADYDRFIEVANRDKNLVPVGYDNTATGRIAATKTRTDLYITQFNKLVKIGTIEANKLINGYLTGKTIQDKTGYVSAPGTIWYEIEMRYIRQKYNCTVGVKKSDVTLYPATQFPNHLA